MNYSNLTYKFILACLFIISMNVNSYSQTESYYDSESFFHVKNPWLKSSNAAALSSFGKNDYMEVTSSYNNVTGEYRKAMQPKTINDYSLDFFGLKRINDFTYCGSFKFNETYNYNRRWSHLMDLDNRIPYVVGDSISGDFRKELFDFNIGISHPFFSSKIDVGIMINYISAMEVKNIDPRPINSFSHLSFSPSFLYKYSKSSSFASSYTYSFKREDIEIKKLGYSQNTLFLFNGLGLVSKENFIYMFNRLYRTEVQAIELSYHYEDSKYMNHSSLGYSLGKTVIEDGKDIIKSEYSFLFNKLSFNSLFSLKGNESFHVLAFSFSFSEDIGIRNVINIERTKTHYLWKKYAENQEYYHKSLFSSIEYKLKMGSWRNNIAANFINNREEREFFPSKFYQEYSNIFLKYNLSKSLVLSNILFSLSTNIAYRHNLSKNSFILNKDNMSLYNIETLKDVLVEDVVTGNFSYNTSNYLSKSLILKCEMPINIYNTKTNSYISFDYTNTVSKDLGQRDFFSLCLGLNI